jgi:hypothetical protein
VYLITTQPLPPFVSESVDELVPAFPTPGVQSCVVPGAAWAGVAAKKIWEGMKTIPEVTKRVRARMEERRANRVITRLLPTLTLTPLEKQGKSPIDKSKKHG